MHQIQEKLLKLIDSEDVKGFTLRDLGKKIGEVYPQKIKHHLQQLEKRGLISIDKNNKNIIRNTHKNNSSKNSKNKNGNFASVPIVGTANCGPATIFATDNIEGYLKISKNILKKCKNIFALRAQGLSMNKAEIDGNTIEDGDYLIIDADKKSPRTGDIVLSVIDEMANIKKFMWDDSNNQVVLMSNSTQHIPPIFVHEDDSFMINGTVIQVIKQPSFS